MKDNWTEEIELDDVVLTIEYWGYDKFSVLHEEQCITHLLNDKAISDIGKIVYELYRCRRQHQIDIEEEVNSKKSILGREWNLKRRNKDLYNRYKDGDITLELAENIAEGRKVSYTDRVPSYKVANTTQLIII